MIDRAGILAWLREENPDRLRALWEEADAVRRATVGDAVHLRGLIEVSNHCRRTCAYCGIRAPRSPLVRYRMTTAEVLAAAALAHDSGFGTVVLQAGEDEALTAGRVEDWIRRIKGETALAVTLSLGEREEEELHRWRLAGADRYLLRFETSDAALYRRIHPDRPGRVSDRIGLLRVLQSLGYEAGSGVMVGIPGQTVESLADDILLFRKLDLDMVGIGPYLPHPDTPLGRAAGAEAAADPVPATETMACKVLALTRLACPEANLPSTTALATLDPSAGRETGLGRGANVIMPNCTPPAYRRLYEIYPAKACLTETEAFVAALRTRLAALGRPAATGPGCRRRGSP